MHLNPMLYPTLALALFVFWAGYWLMGHLRSLVSRIAFMFLAVLLAIPAVLLAVYYLHCFDMAVWFFTFRTMPCSELTAAGAGVLAGMLLALAEQKTRSSVITLPAAFVMLFVLFIGLGIPYVKMLLLPLHDADLTRSVWKDGVCMQSTPSTCGPASAATLLQAQGYAVSERELADECFTSSSGTEIWYLARALQRRGFTTHYLFTRMLPDALPEALPYPAIAGIAFGPRAGHFIAILGKTPDGYLLGDPIRGKVKLTKTNCAAFTFTGFFLRVQRNNH